MGGSWQIKRPIGIRKLDREWMPRLLRRIRWPWLNTTEGALVFERITERGNHLVASTKSAELVKGLKLSFISADEEVSRSAQLNAMELEFARALQRRGA